MVRHTDEKPADTGSEMNARSSILRKNVDMAVVVGSIAISLVVIPAILSFVFVIRGAPSPDSDPLALGLIAMLPGVLMGATSLWVAARG